MATKPATPAKNPTITDKNTTDPNLRGGDVLRGQATTDRTLTDEPTGHGAIDVVRSDPLVNNQRRRAHLSAQAAQRASANNPTFRSLDGSDIHVSLPDGRKAIVNGTARTLPKAFWRAAQKAGAVTEATAQAMRNAPVAGVEDDPVKRKAAIKTVMVDALNLDPDHEENAEAFTPSGVPNASWVSQKVGFPVSKDERDQIWGEVEREADAAESNTGLGVKKRNLEEDSEADNDTGDE